MRVAIALGVFLAGCGEGAIEGGREAALVNGVAHDVNPEVGEVLFDLDGDGDREAACTGTLITPRTVLTAAHCLGYARYLFGLPATGRAYPVEGQLIHPEFDPDRPWEHDLGLVYLDRDVPVEPALVARRTAMVGEVVTLIGFGETDLGLRDNGVKRIGTNDVEVLAPLFFTTAGTDGEANGCRGDSGGPVFAMVEGRPRVLGLMSFVVRFCAGPTRHVRLDLYLDWIDANVRGVLADLDGGVDAGPDAGSDAGPDAGPDAGSDAGRDAGSDAGPDAGSDAGRDGGPGAGSDAMVDVAVDAGPEQRDGGGLLPSMDAGPMDVPVHDASVRFDAASGDAGEPVDEAGGGCDVGGTGCIGWPLLWVFLRRRR